MPNSGFPYQTIVAVEPLPWKLSHEGGVFLMGSCFTENIGSRLVQSGFSCLSNPFGILYNPISMALALRRCLLDLPIGPEYLVEHHGLWHSWLHHGSFSAASPQECLDHCNESIHEAHRFLQQCDTIILTFGTAFLYELREASFVPSVVGNCHKVPASQFVKRMASVDEIVSVFGDIWPLLHSLPCRPHVLLTVSPIRHWADGAHGNQLSKSSLLLAVDRLVGEGCHYFPAYEIVMDELRDYRFYADDMLHPSPLAQEIVWQRFQQCLMSAETMSLAHKYQQLDQLRSHRPINPQSSEFATYESRLQALSQEIQSMKVGSKNSPFIKVGSINSPSNNKK